MLSGILGIVLALGVVALGVDPQVFGLALGVDPQVFGLALGVDPQVFGLALGVDPQVFGLALGVGPQVFGLALGVDPQVFELHHSPMSIRVAGRSSSARGSVSNGLVFLPQWELGLFADIAVVFDA